MNRLDNLPTSLAHRITAETQGEIVRWVGRPNPGKVLFRSLPVWLMGLPWLALSGGIFAALIAVIFFSPKPARFVPIWEYGAMGLALLFVGAFLLVGLAMVGFPFWAWRKSQTMAYVITDKRLLRVSEKLHGAIEVKTVDPSRIIQMTRHQRPDGSGTLTLTLCVYKDSDGDDTRDVEMLVGVPDVQTAERLLAEFRDLRRAA